MGNEKRGKKNQRKNHLSRVFLRGERLQDRTEKLIGRISTSYISWEFHWEGGGNPGDTRGK